MTSGSSTPSSLARLVEGAIRATLRGTVKWMPEPKIGDAFRLKRGSGSVIIRSRDDDGSPPFVFELYDANGTLADSVTSANFDDDLLNELYVAARRSGLEIDALAESLLSELDDDPF